MTDEQLLTVIADGKGSMPGFGAQLSESQLRALRDFVRTLATKQ